MEKFGVDGLIEPTAPAAIREAFRPLEAVDTLAKLEEREAPLAS